LAGIWRPKFRSTRGNLRYGKFLISYFAVSPSYSTIPGKFPVHFLGYALVMAPKTTLKRKANSQTAPKGKKVRLDQPKASSKPEKKRSQPVTALAPPEVSGTESDDEEELLEDAIDGDEGDWEDEDENEDKDDAMDEDQPEQSNKPPKDPNG
jgi:hypothetical protein